MLGTANLVTQFLQEISSYLAFQITIVFMTQRNIMNIWNIWLRGVSRHAPLCGLMLIYHVPKIKANFNNGETIFILTRQLVLLHTGTALYLYYCHYSNNLHLTTASWQFSWVICEKWGHTQLILLNCFYFHSTLATDFKCPTSNVGPLRMLVPSKIVWSRT